MNSPWNVVKELEADNSRLAKEAIIRREALAGNDEFFAGCKLALDSMITFGVKKVPESSASGPGLPWDEFLNLVIQLSVRQLTGHAAQDAVQNAMNRSTEAQWNNWYRRILIKDMRAGFSVRAILMDGKFEKVKNELALGVCNTTEAKEHMSKAECSIRRIKERT